jgi:hypothetical protein
MKALFRKDARKASRSDYPAFLDAEEHLNDTTRFIPKHSRRQLERIARRTWPPPIINLF